MPNHALSVRGEASLGEAVGLRSCLEIGIVARWRSDCGPARRDGGKNKDCSELHDAIFAPVVTQGRNSGATAVDCEFPNSFLGDCQKRIYRIARSFCSDSRRNNRRIVHYVTVIATQKLGKMTSKLVCSLIEITLGCSAAKKRISAHISESFRRIVAMKVQFKKQ